MPALRLLSTTSALAIAAVFIPSAAQAAPETTAVVQAGGGEANKRPGAQARRYLGASASRNAWHSGAWTGGHLDAKRATRWGTWRGTPSDVATTYPERQTWRKISNSTWHIDTYRGFRGRLMYGMPLLPADGSANLADVARGKHDAVFRKVARDLKSRGRGNAIVRIGWEGNGHWYPWSADANSAKNYQAAFRRASRVMKSAAPGLVIDFDINCGSPLRGQSNRLDSLTKLYPGDAYVDLIGCDVYDWHTTGAIDEASWRRALTPKDAPGLADVARFARARGKGMSVPEWGLAAPHAGGHGDNPFYITKMRQFFTANADVLAVESYFNEPKEYIRNSLWTEAPQNPLSAQAYRRLW
ncbi:glycoside hydrolase family 26 protein [Gephyromycinifex aptenodytis]|uniref:glycoside hydrolase family 26 protein n=1 Tax=Gephyromycinifex aptenodytis TaxID=2716227 RepID=UPI0014456628|nr:glycosyl hydrolase [Gephyromycinifex aptenodytis]